MHKRKFVAVFLLGRWYSGRRQLLHSLKENITGIAQVYHVLHTDGGLGETCSTVSLKHTHGSMSSIRETYPRGVVNGQLTTYSGVSQKDFTY